MKLIDYISPKIIDLNVPFSSKKRLFEQLAIKIGEDSKEVRAIYKSLVDREKVGVTSLGNGVAIPHGKCLEDREIRLHIMVLNKAVNYESIDDGLVQLIVCIIFPKETDETHDQLLKQIGKVFKKHRVFKKIIMAESANEIVNILINESI